MIGRMQNSDSLRDDIQYGTNIITGDEYLETMIAIADVGSNMVKKTLGPYGSTTIIDDGMFTYPTKDGWSILKNLRFSDSICNTLYNVLKQVSFDLVNKVGDGTTTAFIGATIFIHKIIEYQKTHEFRQSEFLETLNELTERIVKALRTSKYVHKIDVDGDFSDINKIAYISSNGNNALASMIQKIYKETHNPNIYVSLDSSSKLSYQIQTGYKLDCKPLNQKGYRNCDDGTFILKDRSLVAIFDHNVTYNEHEKLIGALSRYASAHNTSIFVLAPHFDDIMTNIIGTSVDRMLQNGQVPNIMLIQVPLANTIQREYLSDLVLLTNAQTFDYGKVRAFNVLVHNQTAIDEDKIEDALLNTEQYSFDTPEDIIQMCCGKTDHIIVDEKYLIVRDYENIVNKQVYENTLADVKKTFEETKEKANRGSTALRKDFMNAYQRYTKLFGSMGVIKVGGASELEKHCLKDSVDDAVLACRSAFDHGYVRGLNLAMINVIEGVDSYNELESEILQMLRDTFVEMSLTVLRNKYDDTIRRNVPIQNLEQGLGNARNIDIIEHAIEFEYGYDLVEDVFMTDDECTVINSTQTDVEVLKGMVSILSTMLTSNQFLSINRSYDRTMGKKQMEEAEIKKQVEMTKAVTKAILTEINRESNPSNGGFLSSIRKMLNRKSFEK